MWVFCSGMMRSGSTLQYQIAKTLIEEAGRGEGVGSCVPGRFRELLRRHPGPNRVHVVKSHRYVPTAHRRLREGDARSIYIYRDLRDVVVSMMHKESKTFRQLMDEGFVHDLLRDDAVWSARPNTLVSVYEEVIADVRSEVARIAEFLDIEVDAVTLDRIAEEHSLARQNERLERFDFGEAGVAEGRANLVDPETLLHHNHVRSGAAGQWVEELSSEQVAEVEAIAGDWLAARGYALSHASAGPGTVRRRVRAVRRRWAADAGRLAQDVAFRGRPARAALNNALVRPLRRLSDAVTSVGFATTVGRPLYRLAGQRPGSRPKRLHELKRVLVVRVDEIGDVVLTSPLLRELRRNLPDADVTLVVKPGVRNLVERCPHVDRVLTYDDVAGREFAVALDREDRLGLDGAEVSGLFGRLKRHRRALRLARRHLWRRRLDLALLPRWARDRYHGVFVTYFSGAARRVGYSETVTPAKQEMNAGEDRLFTRVLGTDSVRHEVERGLDLLRELGGEVRDEHLELWTDEEDRAAAARLFEEHDVEPGDTVVALGIGAGSQRRVWPLPRFAEVAGVLRARHGARFVLLGSAEDRVLGETFERHTGFDVVNLVGRTTLREAAAILQRCDLYVGNDTGVMHLAAAAGLPVVEISCHPQSGSPEHDHSPERFGPWGVERRVLRPAEPLPPCTDGCSGRVAHCITAITVDQVLEASGTLIDALPHARHAATEPLP